MSWIDKKDEMDTSGGRLRRSGGDDGVRRPDKKLYTVDEVARIFKVTKKTVFKWMAYDKDPSEAIIPPEAWYKMKNGQIRIDEWIVLKLLNPDK